jgi:hypothetical protein
VCLGELADLLLKLEDLSVVIADDPEAGRVDLGDVLDLSRELAYFHPATSHSQGGNPRGAIDAELDRVAATRPATVASNWMFAAEVRLFGAAGRGAWWVCSDSRLAPVVLPIRRRIGWHGRP